MSENRKLASIQKIIEITPIKDADAIEKVCILGWELVAKKGEFKPGDYCVYFEIDSLLPDKFWCKFMESRKFKVKTIKLKGQISQGLALPISSFEELKSYRIYEGRDLTELLGVQKIGVKPVPKIHPFWKFFRKIWFKYLASYYYFVFGKPKGKSQQFPTHIVSKTDESRIQSNPSFIENNIGRQFYISEKLDGCSVTLFNHMKESGICSRNLQLDLNGSYKLNDTREKIVSYFKNDVDKKFEKFKAECRNVVLQGELVGENIQKNKYAINGLDFYVFHAFDTAKRETLPIKDALELAKKLGFKWVPIVGYFTMDLTHTVKGFVDISSEKSLLNKKQEREGIVIRSIDGNKVSFKAISPKFLLKFEDDSLDDEGEQE
jgi:hypothetical protein